VNPKQKYFNILGISPTTDKSVIKKAYRKLAFQYHPDKNSSVNAQAKFIEITDAYEIVTGVKSLPRLKSRMPNESEPNQPTPEDRVRAAKERYEKSKQKELEEEARYYFQLISGKRWQFIKRFSVASTILSVLFVLDYFLKENINYELIQSMFVGGMNQNAHFEVNNSNYYFLYDEARYIIDYPIIQVNSTPIFNDLKFVRILSFKGENIYIKPVLSFLYFFPILPIALCLPLITVMYKRPNALFTFMHMFSLYVIPVLFVVVLLSNWRIFQIFV